MFSVCSFIVHDSFVRSFARSYFHVFDFSSFVRSFLYVSLGRSFISIVCSCVFSVVRSLARSLARPFVFSLSRSVIHFCVIG